MFSKRFIMFAWGTIKHKMKKKKNTRWCGIFMDHNILESLGVGCFKLGQQT